MLVLLKLTHEPAVILVLLAAKEATGGELGLLSTVKELGNVINPSNKFKTFVLYNPSDDANGILKNASKLVVELTLTLLEYMVELP